MKEERAAIPRIRRLAVVVGALFVLAAVGAPTAAAELGLPEQAESGLDAQLREATTGTLTQATETVDQTAAPTPTQAAETLAQTTAPVLEPVRQAQLLPGTAETIEAVTESVVEPVAETLPVAEAATQPLLRQTRSTLDSVIEATAPAHGALDVATDAPRTASAPVEETVAAPREEQAIVEAVSERPVARTPDSSDRDELTTSPRRAPGVPLASPAPSDFSALPSLTGADLGGAKASPSLPSAPAPFAPGAPLSGFASASAAAGAGVFALLLAALAGALIMAAPGLGRRLRPGLAPGPQPIPQLSLERPG
jgi:hypothetical protein